MVTLEISAKISELQNKLPAIYSDFFRNYNAAQSHPENEEYKNALAAIKDTLNAEENNLRERLASHRGAYNASATRVTDYNGMYKEALWGCIFLIIGIIAIGKFIFSANSYQFSKPSLGGALAGFIVYLLIILLYIRYYGVSGWIFVIIVIPFIIYGFGLFVKKCAVGTTIPQLH